MESRHSAARFLPARHDPVQWLGRYCISRPSPHCRPLNRRGGFRLPTSPSLIDPRKSLHDASPPDRKAALPSHPTSQCHARACRAVSRAGSARNCLRGVGPSVCSRTRGQVPWIPRTCAAPYAVDIRWFPGHSIHVCYEHTWQSVLQTKRPRASGE
ncbi:MAG: hypothetical protein M2R45_01675 [Verrucomicrobia subdivision 3 bacterium]|nr:hypothetical protein [Limisphaerales bacterium]MCS1412825.1 hypothetical protein [Limisphaerales bacterium]